MGAINRLSFRKTELFLLSFLLIMVASFYTSNFFNYNNTIVDSDIEITDGSRNDHTLSLPSNAMVSQIILAEESSIEDDILPVFFEMSQKLVKSIDFSPTPIFDRAFINLLPEKVHLYDLFCDWQYDFIA